MSEPSSSVPDEVADAEVKDSSAEDTPSTVELDIDQDKVDAWDEIKGDYQVDPDAESESTSESESDAESESTSVSVSTSSDGDDGGGDGSPAAEADSSQS